METTARNRTIGGIVIGAIILILLLVLFSCTVTGDPKSSPKKDPTTGESALPGEQDPLEPDEKPSESDEPEEVDGDDIVPAANTGVTFIPAGNVPSGSTPTCELDPSACEPNRPPGAGVDICEIRPDLTQCQPPAPPTTPPGEEEPPTEPEEPEPPLCGLPLLPPCDDDGNGDPADTTKPEPVDVNECRIERNATAVTVTWQPRRDDDGERVKGYTVGSYRGLSPSKTGPRSATYEGLDPGDTYTFWVTATDTSNNESDRSDVECVMDVEAPDEPANLTVTPVEPTASTLEVSWDESEDNPKDGGAVEGVTYNILRNGEPFREGYGDTSFVDEDLEAGTKYTYEVQAVDLADNRSKFAKASETTGMPPTVPQNVSVTDADLAGFTVSWSASTDLDNVTPQNQIEYIVTVDGGLLCGSPRSEPGATSMRVVCLLGQDSSVTVTAVDGDGNESAPSESASARGSQGGEGGNVGLRSNTPGTDKPDAPADKPALPEVPKDAPKVEVPLEEKSPRLPGLGDVLSGDDKAAEAPAEPEASPSESESPAARPTTEEPAEEPAEEPTKEEPPAEEDDEGGLLDNIVSSVTSAVAAVF